MNNSKKSHKLNNLSSPPPPPTKLKIITNGNGMTAIPVNGKVRGRPPKHNANATATATNALDVFTFVSCSFPSMISIWIIRLNFECCLFQYSEQTDRNRAKIVWHHLQRDMDLIKNSTKNCIQPQHRRAVVIV